MKKRKELKNIEDIQNHLLNCLERVDNKEMDIEELSIVSKGCEALFSSVKLQLTYSHMRNQQPHIPFLQECNQGKPISIDSPPSLKKLLFKG